MNKRQFRGVAKACSLSTLIAAGSILGPVRGALGADLLDSSRKLSERKNQIQSKSQIRTVESNVELSRDQSKVLVAEKKSLELKTEPAPLSGKPPVILAPQPRAGLTGDQNFSMIADSYFEDMFKLDPSWATQSGFHEHDTELENLSAEFVAARIAGLKSYRDTLNSLDPRSLSRNLRHDREMLLGHINNDLLNCDELKLWKKDPDIYSTGVSSSIFNLVKRDFAPIQTRMKDVIAREKQIPQALEFAKQNLDANLVPKIYAEIAVEQLPGAVEFFKDFVPGAFKGVKDEKLQAQLAETTGNCVTALKDYQSFLEKMIAKGECKGDFAYGEEAYRKKLLYQEMVSEPIDSLLERGNKELKRLQSEFVALAKEIDAGKTPQQCYEDVAKEHPKPTQLLTDIRNLLERIRKFCTDQKIVTIASPERPIVTDTPSFMRALTFASLDVPGAYEKKAVQSFYYVTPPEPNWTPAHVEEHMRAFSNCDLLCTSIHEAYPGHFVMYLHVKQTAPTKVRRLIGSALTEEGWAHYCEQMLLDEGFNKGDKKLKLVQLHDALLRNCRYIVGIKMHTRGMSLQDGVKFFVEEGYQEKANAEREAKRGTSDPTYLVYTLGKLDILALRDDYKKLKGSQFSLRDFHDRFLSGGYPPVKIIREEMIVTPEK
ncbi:MAG: DUF885 domain-containing protein [Candidatus Melainabacteria bacterium]|nr:MAG: DUF885 domain-containing protein [Candidatus Melainabacteria bacterium]